MSFFLDIAIINVLTLKLKALRNYDWALTYPEKPWNRKNLNGLFAVSDMWVKVTERVGKSNK
jgi:hypothetical protein